MTGPLLEIEGLTFRYRRATEPALRDLSLTVEAGEVLLVAGPSGCGKSTLIRAINGLIPHAYRGELRGSVRLDGRSTGEMRLREIGRRIGTVLQDPERQIVASTVASELAFGPENVGIDPDEIGRRMDRVAERTSIGHLLERTVDELSGGERQLITVAGALMLEPSLLVVDEPLANLDPATAHRLLSILRDQADRGTAIVIVEHRVEDALDLRPDRALYLDGGATRFIGAVDAFLEVVDPRDVKVPFEVVLDWARRNPPVAVPPELAPSPVDGSPPRLELRGVVAGYDEREVLHGLSARFGRRSVVAVLGPNGSGKTTLFKSAIGLLRPTRGEVLVDGDPVGSRSVADLATTFGYVFQNPRSMLFERTVSDELWFGPRNLGRDPARRDGLVADVLRRVGLQNEEAITQRPPLTLSFGQQKRLAIAIALALEPGTLMLDEPSAGQDHRTASSFMREVRSIDGLESVYFVTHDVDLALTHADEVILMREGRLVASGPPLEVAADRQRWLDCNLRVTSLMEANARWVGATGRFMPAEALAYRVAAGGGAAGS
jgi:energy-coupling factor transport system ATP-binding protein